MRHLPLGKSPSIVAAVRVAYVIRRGMIYGCSLKCPKRTIIGWLMTSMERTWMGSTDTTLQSSIGKGSGDPGSEYTVELPDPLSGSVRYK